MKTQMQIRDFPDNWEFYYMINIYLLPNGDAERLISFSLLLLCDSQEEKTTKFSGT